MLSMLPQGTPQDPNAAGNALLSLIQGGAGGGAAAAAAQAGWGGAAGGAQQASQEQPANGGRGRGRGVCSAALGTARSGAPPAAGQDTASLMASLQAMGIDPRSEGAQEIIAQMHAQQQQQAA